MKTTIVTLLCFACIVVSIGAQWIPVQSGLNGASLWCFSETDSVMYVGSRFGQVFRSQDSGAHWLRCPDPAPEKFVFSIYSEPGFVFCGAGNGVIYRSLDRGENWDAVSLSDTSCEVWQIIRTSTSMLLAGTSSGCYRSSDDGKHWIKTMDQGLNTTSVQSLAELNSTIYAVVYGSGIMTSTDMGDNWTEMSNGLGALQPTSIISTKSTLYVNSLYSAPALSLDSGKSWKQLSSSYFSSGGTIVGLVHNTLVATDGTNDILTSYDGGLNWFVNNTEFWNYIGCKVFASNEQLVALVSVPEGGGSCLLSTDLGTSWVERNEGMYALTTTCMIVDRDQSWIGTSGNGVFLSTDEGLNWNATSATTTEKAMSVGALLKTDSLVYVGSQNLLSTNAMGSHWYTYPATYFTSGMSVTSLAYDMGRLYVSLNAAGTGLLISTDNGTTWFQSLAGLNSSVMIRGISVNAGTISLATNQGLYFSTDLGMSFDFMSGTDSFGFVTCVLRNGSAIWAGTFNQGVYRSLDAGLHWQHLLDGMPSRAITALLQYGNTMFASAISYGSMDSSKTYWIIQPGGLYAMNKNAQSWIDVSGDLESRDIMSCTVYNDTVWVGVQAHGVFKTDARPLIASDVKELDPGPRARTSQVLFCSDAILSLPLSGTGSDLRAMQCFDYLGNTTSVTVLDQHPNQVQLDLSRLGAGLYFFTIDNCRYTLVRE